MLSFSQLRTVSLKSLKRCNKCSGNISGSIRRKYSCWGSSRRSNGNVTLLVLVALAEGVAVVLIVAVLEVVILSSSGSCISSTGSSIHTHYTTSPKIKETNFNNYHSCISDLNVKRQQHVHVHCGIIILDKSEQY